ncbi:hypothetical protein H5410_037695 [Solanum commersonii]|uniref:Uncharacterized protein n=1 Tax=Solanum commersonii TaxID=4109 RepID=A0A9J5Y967_SOLCO|nr:hypothetical protein H5410_037695 [Solanum commersonii]
MVPPHSQASNADERDHYALGKRILLQNESSGSCFPETSKALEPHFSNYLKVVSDIGIEDTIVDNMEDNGVDKNVLIEGNSTKVVLQGIRGDVTNEVDEEFSDPDYNLSDEDDDFQYVIDDQQVLVDNQQVLVDDQQVKKLRGRPKNASVNVPVSSGILVPLQNVDVESDYGLIGAVKDLFSEAEHRNCVRHMYQNFKQKHKGKALKDLVWNADRASNKVIFQKCMEELDQEDKAAREWFNNPERPFQSWTRALFRTNTKCDMLLNNLCESFNR